MQSLAVKLVLVLGVVVTALIGLATLTIGGTLYLLRGLNEAYATLVSPPSAHALTGLTCMLVILLCFGLLFAAMKFAGRGAGTPSRRRRGDDLLAVNVSRTLIRQYPWEAAGVALLAGVAMEDDDARALLLRSGRLYMRTLDAVSSAAEASTDETGG